MTLAVRGHELLDAWRAEDPTRRTQTAIAKRVGVSQASVSEWARRRSRPDGPLRQALRELTGIPEDAWLTDVERADLARSIEYMRAHPIDVDTLPPPPPPATEEASS